MSLSNFIQLNEGQMRNKAYLVFEAFVDNLDSAHYTETDKTRTYNVGNTAKLSRFLKLDFVLRGNRNNAPLVRLAKRKDKDRYAIVLDVESIPSPTEVDTLLNTKNITKMVVHQIEEYMNTVSSKGSESLTTMTTYEREKLVNSREYFENVYKSLASAMKDKLETMKQIVGKFEKEKEETGNPSRKATLELAIDKVKKEYMGESFKDFQKITMSVLKDVDPYFSEHMNKDNKNLLLGRLQNFYQELMHD